MPLTEGRILGPLIGFALPVLAALFLQTMYGAVDLLIVGQYAATTDVSAVATGSQLMHSVTTVLVGLAILTFTGSIAASKGLVRLMRLLIRGIKSCFVRKGNGK